MGLEIGIEEKDPGVFKVTPRGEINTETHKILEGRLEDIVYKARALVFEMAGVSYISSMGLSAIFRIKLAIEEHGGIIALAGMQPQVQQVFEAMKILSPQMFASLQEADDYLDKFLDDIQKGTIKPRQSWE